MVSGRTRLRLALLLAVLLLPLVARAQDPAELEFWQSVQSDDTVAEYQVYLDSFPHGRFAALARLRIARLSRASETLPPQPSAPQPSAPQSPAPPAPGANQAWVRPTKPRVGHVDGVTLDINAEPLRQSSNLRLAVLPADAPDTPADLTAFVELSTPVPPTRLHLSLPGGPPGRDEVRLYHIPPFADAFTVAARAPVITDPGLPGATLARDLVREAVRLGPVRFEAQHRDRPMLVEAAFLRVRPQTEWNLQWFGPGGVRQTARQILVISIGQPGVAADAAGSRGEVVCLLDATDPALLNRVAAMQVGTPVAATGIPTLWASASAADPVLLDRCALRG